MRWGPFSSLVVEAESRRDLTSGLEEEEVNVAKVEGLGCFLSSSYRTSFVICRRQF